GRTDQMTSETNASGKSRWLAGTRWSMLALVPALAIFAVTSHAAELNPRDMILLDRLTWGINASSAAHLQAVGWERWLGEQLHPADAALRDAVRSQIEAMP